MRLLLVCLVVLLASTGMFGAESLSRRVPPPGLELPTEVRKELDTRTTALATAIEQLRRKAATQLEITELLPDVEVFHKAVRWALDYGEFYRSNEVQGARELLQIGSERAAQLQTGQAPWTQATGLVVRAYVSRLDGSVQPYGLVVPGSYASVAAGQHRLDVWLHGRDNNLTELKFIAGRLKSAGEFVPKDTLVLHPYGRYCNAFKFAGEVDVMEALEHARKNYRIDPDRLAIRGFSMGGAGCWHLATHYAGLWAAAAPGAGFAETARYSGILTKRPDLPAYERALWHCYDATDYARNLHHCPTIAYSGELDKQKQAADVMSQAMAENGLELLHLIGPKTEHKYEPASKEELSRRFDALMAQGRDATPNRVRFTTWTLRYPEMRWVRIEGLECHWARADIDVEIVSSNFVRVAATNVSQFSLLLPSMVARSGLEFEIDGRNLRSQPKDRLASGRIYWEKTKGRWAVSRPTSPAELRKSPGRQGPIDDAFMESFVMVQPTGKAWNQNIGAWAETELELATSQWRAQFRGVAQVRKDDAISDDDIARSNLILWGDPGSNKILARLLSRLPVRWTRKELRLAGDAFPSATSVLVMIYPNPLNPSRYVVINSGFTFADFGEQSNALQTPKLPDFAVVDVRVPRSERLTKGVRTAGFFDEEWKF